MKGSQKLGMKRIVGAVTRDCETYVSLPLTETSGPNSARFRNGVLLFVMSKLSSRVAIK